MHITKTLSFLSLGSGAYSFMVRAYEGDNCSGGAHDINVWDNTCRMTHLPSAGIRSFEVTAYGAGRQRATFWWENFCSYSGGQQISKDWWADGGSDTFLKGRCINLGYKCSALGSHSA